MELIKVLQKALPVLGVPGLPYPVVAGEEEGATHAYMRFAKAACSDSNA